MVVVSSVLGTARRSSDGPSSRQRQRDGNGEHRDGGDGAKAQQPLVDPERTRHGRFRLDPRVVAVVRELRTVEVVEVIDRLERFGRRRVARRVTTRCCRVRSMPAMVCSLIRPG